MDASERLAAVGQQSLDSLQVALRVTEEVRDGLARDLASALQGYRTLHLRIDKALAELDGCLSPGVKEGYHNAAIRAALTGAEGSDVA